ncbi:uncharacterized protein V1513DRAFT_450681 [Lipomyces chichibuensis]|uniref:uncharacterized protein n=1 Tax=Lipomyces chichibuensis TaxID=1546026 RepID=UPI0033430F44
MADSKEGTPVSAISSDPPSVTNTTTNDSAHTEPAIVEKIKLIKENNPSGNKSAKSNAEETQSRKRSLEESSPATDDEDDAEISADNILKRPRAGESALNDGSDSKEKESSYIQEVTENSATDSKVIAEREEATEGGEAGRTEPPAAVPHAGSTEEADVKATAGAAVIEGGDAGKTEPAGPSHAGSTGEKIEVKGTSAAPVSKEPQKASPEGTENEQAKTSQNGTTDENKPAVPSLFGSSVSSASLFGTSSSASSPFAFTGKSIFGSGSAFASGGSDRPMPFSAFSSNNPFLNAISKDNSKDNDNEENGEVEDEDNNDSADNFDQPYVQLNLLEKKKVETGEEMETSVFNCRAKLYSLDPTEADKGWKERGIGVLHLNVLKDDTVSAVHTPEPSSADASKESTPTVRERKSKARIVMRADGVLKVILNLPLVKGIEVRKGMKSSLVSEKFVRISAWENQKPVQYALRMGNENVAAEFYDTAESLINL